jgi:hypothetical protein
LCHANSADPGVKSGGAATQPRILGNELPLRRVAASGDAYRMNKKPGVVFTTRRKRKIPRRNEPNHRPLR